MDPSMLIAFLIKDESDWRSWREAVNDTPGKPVIHVADTEPSLHSQSAIRENAVDDVETLDDDDDDNDEGDGEGRDGELIERPP